MAIQTKEKPLQRLGMLACPRCINGQMFHIHRTDWEYNACLQCGYHDDEVKILTRDPRKNAYPMGYHFGQVRAEHLLTFAWTLLLLGLINTAVGL